MSAALAHSWDYYDEDDELEESEYDEDDGYAGEDEDDEEEYLVASSPAAYAAYQPASAYANQSAAYAYPGYESAWMQQQYEQAYAGAQPRRAQYISLGSIAAGIVYNRLLMWAIVLVVGWLIVSSLMSWLTGLNQVKGEVSSFGSLSGMVIAADGLPKGEVAAGAPAGAMSVEGKPSISVTKIEAVLRQYKSPAVGIGQAMYDLGIKYGIDPAFALAFFIHESSAGTQGIAVTTKSIGNIRQTSDSGFEGYQGFRKYPTWEAGAEDWYKLIKNLYINGWNLRTVDAIIPKYAPAADRNNPPAYINQVKTMVAGWRTGS